MKTATKQPEFNSLTVMTFSANREAAKYVCGVADLLMGVEGYRSVRTIPGPARAVDRIVSEIEARAAEYGAQVTVSRKSSAQWSAPYAICHETTIVLRAE